MSFDGNRITTPSRLEAAAVLLLASAWGWTAGNFGQPSFSLTSQILITALHCLPCGLVVALGAFFLTSPWPTWARRGISLVAVFSVVALAVIVPIGVSNPDPNSFGPHNFADYVPVALLVVGIAAWLVSQLRRRGATATSSSVPSETSELLR
jgi:peptidoglycan/LPS O-acetylase OafA/YrhL